jgi:hypothetical protein
VHAAQQVGGGDAGGDGRSSKSRKWIAVAYAIVGYAGITNHCA